MGSPRPYLRDSLTGMLRYVADAISPPGLSAQDRAMAHFKKNYARLTGPARTLAPPAIPSRQQRQEVADRAYYNLYYLGHRTHH